MAIFWQWQSLERPLQKILPMKICGLRRARASSPVEEGDLRARIRKRNAIIGNTWHFSQFFLSPDSALCRYWKHKPIQVEQTVIPNKFIEAALHSSHNLPITHLGYYMRAGRSTTGQCYAKTQKHIFLNVQCVHIIRVQQKSRVPMLQYRLPSAPRDLVSIDLAASSNPV